MEFQVVLLDSAEEMLGIAKKEAEASGIATRISFHHADANRLQELFEAASFDLVVCHNLLEYVADPAAIAAKIAHVLRKDAVASFVTRNRAGIKSGDWALAKENLSGESVLDSLYGKPVRVFEPRDIIEMLARSGLEPIALYGIRVFSDHRDPKDLADEVAYQQILQLELLLGAKPEFAGIARYTQVIARLANGSQEKRS